MLIGWTGDNGDPDKLARHALLGDAVKGSNLKVLLPAVRGTGGPRAAGDPATSPSARRLARRRSRFSAQRLPFSPIAHSTVYQPASKVIDIKIEPLGLCVSTASALL